MNGSERVPNRFLTLKTQYLYRFERVERVFIHILLYILISLYIPSAVLVPI
ncbi:hypothetical protein HM1_2895 [Heliomicrobium modesticaldum Ice1]|uniref:Uncharacterized protein n=1 Tax=Heliobacterium modesticaldum (strain ATCC 51547 / Ice1) TaxID=498761 RepID=B0TCV3_HELMI|nr:hypothetical protein HM1_2895 [Heliomicrobium modesticaldum Ice1]